MSFLAPAAAILALTLPAIVALYFLKIRRPTRIVPALHLWPNQIRDRQANVPWQRLRPSWLLFLQLLAAAVLVAVSEQQDASAREFEIGLFVMLVVLFALGVVLFVLAILAAFTLGCHNGIHWPPWLAGGIVVVLLLYLIGRWLRT